MDNNKEDIHEIHRLRRLHQDCIRTGDFKQMSTRDMKAISEQLQKTAESLVMFPACECARQWLCQEHARLDRILFHRMNG